MAKTQIDGQKINIKRKLRYPQFEFDMLQMYCGIPYTIDVPTANGTIEIVLPTVGDIVRAGHKRFDSTLNIFITNTTSYRLLLWKQGIDWNTLSDFELFCMLYQQIDDEIASMLFKDIKFSDFQLYSKKLGENETVVLYNQETDTEINEEVYQHIAQYLRMAFNIHPDEKITKEDGLKAAYIRKDESALRQAELNKETDKNDSSLQPLISACVNHPGFKYNLKEVMDISICEFYDSVKRLQLYENCTALMKGMYSGMIDGSKIDSNAYNFMKAI